MPSFGLPRHQQKICLIFQSFLLDFMSGCILIRNGFWLPSHRNHHELEILPLFQANSPVLSSGPASLFTGVPYSQSSKISPAILPSVIFQMEVKFTQHETDCFKVDNSAAFTTFTTLCNHHIYLVLRSFSHPQKFTFSTPVFLKNFLLHFCSTLAREVILLLPLPVLGLILPQVWLRVALSLQYKHSPNTWRYEHQTINQVTSNSDAYRVMLNEKEIMKLHSMMPIQLKNQV